MRLNEEVIPKRYAQAHLNLYFDIFTQKCFDSLLRLEGFFKENKKFSAYLAMPTIPYSAKEKVMENVCSAMDICKTIKILVHTLIRHRRIELFKHVVKQLVVQYRKRVNLVVFSVKTSHDITQEQKEKIRIFLEQKIKGNVKLEFEIDPALISGLRIKGETYMWEHSIAQHLKKVKRFAIQRVKLW